MSSCFEEFSENFPCLCRRQEIASWYLGATSAKKEENRPPPGLSVTDGDEAESRRWLAALDTDKAVRKAKADPQLVTAGIQGNDRGMLGTAE